jgi:hypothetical protein
MRADLEGALEGIKEKVAQQEARRLAVLEHGEQARLEREKGEGREAEGQRPTSESAVGKYASMIESRVRERKWSGRGSEGP